MLSDENKTHTLVFDCEKFKRSKILFLRFALISFSSLSLSSSFFVESAFLFNCVQLIGDGSMAEEILVNADVLLQRKMIDLWHFSDEIEVDVFDNVSALK